MDKNINLEFSERLKQLRISAHWSLGKTAIKIEQIAHQTISKERISDYENGRRCPDIYTLSAFAEVFNVSLDYLWFGSKNRCVIYRQPPKESAILKSIETLIRNRILIIGNGEGDHLMDFGEEGIWLSFAREYNELECSTASSTILDRGKKALEERYIAEMEANKQRIATSKAPDQIALFFASKQNLIFKMIPLKPNDEEMAS